MASSFKIPKKKRPEDSDSASMHMQSPLSRLQSPTPHFKSYANQSGRGGAGKTPAGNSSRSSAENQSPPSLKKAVKRLLGFNSPHRASTANHRAAAGSNSQSQTGQRGETSAPFSNGWRPKRASDRLLQPADVSESPPSPQKKSDLSSSSPFNHISVKSVDSLAELRTQEHAGSLSSVWRRGEESDSGDSPEKKDSSEDDYLSPPRLRIRLSAQKTPHKDLHRPPISRATPDRRRSLDRTAWRNASSNLQDDTGERERKRWSEFRERKRTKTPTVLQNRSKKQERQIPAEPIVLSSEDEEDGDDEGDLVPKTQQRSITGSGSRLRSSELRGNTDKVYQPSPLRGDSDGHESRLPSSLQLDFSSLHAGLTHASANGELLITEHCVSIPLTGAEEGVVNVVASQVRGYGVWDGGVVRCGTLLADWDGPAPSLLFLWVTDAQANLLQRELSDIQGSHNSTGPPCTFLLLVLKEQLQELQAALLASILDMKEYRRGCCSSSPSSPLEWTDGLLLLHNCPPPLDQHLLSLLGHSEETSAQSRTSRLKVNSSGQQQLSSRLIQYPAAPCKGRISVSKEDLACLARGEFLNDVIIDFYLKYLLLEGVGGPVAGRSHIFSSFFYKQLSRRRAAGEDDAPSVPDRYTRHQRVKTWTRHVDIFTKDFLFVPVNQEAHWFLVVVCFPGLEKVQHVDLHSLTGVSEESGGKRSISLRSQHQPDCTEQGQQRDSVLKRPCILVMDSLKLSYHENVCRLLRDYLHVEWEVRRGTPRLFTSDSMRSSNCRVPLQDNSSDCGLYLLQYAESFLQNPVVHFDLPLCLENWFPRQRVRQKREEIRSLILTMHRSQSQKN